ncbi:MAG: hypothetical protein M1818_002669 [Claussenomyces sp. TS43310]|nr:MAG: hypothetical protein M1818_002669 [Claussenomyces sp. TS43310]
MRILVPHKTNFQDPGALNEEVAYHIAERKKLHDNLGALMLQNEALVREKEELQDRLFTFERELHSWDDPMDEDDAEIAVEESDIIFLQTAVERGVQSKQQLRSEQVNSAQEEGGDSEDVQGIEQIRTVPAIELISPTPNHLRYAPPLKAYIMSSTWLREPGTIGPIHRAEESILDHQPQKALVALDRYLSVPLSSPRSSCAHYYINAVLLKSCVLRIAGDATCALRLAEHAVRAAHDGKLLALLCKAQMYRGLCLVELAAWPEAHWCFVRSANVRFFEGRVGTWTDRAWTRWCTEAPGRKLDADFENIPGVSERK